MPAQLRDGGDRVAEIVGSDQDVDVDGASRCDVAVELARENAALQRKRSDPGDLQLVENFESG